MRVVGFLAATALTVSSSAALARPRPDFDAFTDSPAALPLLDAELSPSTRRLAELSHITQVERRLGVPTFLWPARVQTSQFSTRALGVVVNGGGAPGQPSLPEMGVTAEQAARRYLYEYAELYRFNPEALATVPLSRTHDTGSGAIILEFRRDVAGTPVFRDSIKVALNRRLEAVALSGYLSPLPQSTPPVFTLTAQGALDTAFRDLTEAALPAEALVLGESQGEWQWFNGEGVVAANGSRIARPLRTRPVLFPLTDALVPAYHLELEVTPVDATTSSELYAYVISARDGAILFRKDLSAADSYRVWADPVTKIPHDGPQGTAGTPHPTGVPDGYQAPFAAPSLITLQSSYPFSKNDPWLPANATVTRGNNVSAFADLATPDHLGDGDLQPATTAALTFDRVYDVNAAPRATANQTAAAVTQLFYNVNFFHDWYYDLGFNEAALNGQDNNLGRGGLGNDALLAEAQDFSGTNNANMQTPADGSRPTMQMYIFDGNAPRSVKLTAPSAKELTANAADFGPVTFELSAQVALAVDGAAPANDACTALTTQLPGRIALVDRGTCDFATKYNNAVAAGATGVLIADNIAGAFPPAMSGTVANATRAILSVTQADGASIKTLLSAGQAVTVTLSRAAALQRDGTLDNAIVAHEWGHFISGRLVGNSVGLTGAQARGMGEGFGDFHALLMVVREEDAALPNNANWNGVYGLASYSQAGSGVGYYFGIRRVPYTTDTAKNGLTFKHIAANQPLPDTVPTLFGTDGVDNAEVHNSGEIFATMLWEGYAGLLRSKPRLSFAEAQLRMRGYMVAMYKLSPNSPTMLEMRDALLAVAMAKDPEDFEVFGQAFAKRGAGIVARAPDRASATNSPVVESFDGNGDLSLIAPTLKDSLSSCDQDGVLDSGEAGVFTVTVKNIGWTRLTATTGTVSTTTAGITFPEGPKLTFGTVLSNGTATGSVKIAFAKGTSGTVNASFAVTVSDPKMTVTTGRSANFPLQLNSDLAGNATVADAGNRCTNRVPVAISPAERTVTSGEQVVLSSAGSFDMDNDPLTSTWSQTDGAPVTVQGDTFTAPNVQEPTVLTFQLIVSDGKSQSVPTSSKLTVNPRSGTNDEGLRPAVLPDGTTLNDGSGGLADAVGCNHAPTDAAPGLLLLLTLAAQARRRRSSRHPSFTGASACR
ncbi:MAG: M36 family metallopeptidase [Myxococcaceae bacterium]